MDWERNKGKRGRKHVSVFILKKGSNRIYKKNRCFEPRITVHMKQFSAIIRPV